VPATTTAFFIAEAAAAESAPATARTWPPIRLGPRLIDIQRAAAHVCTIQRSNRSLRFRFIRHLHKRKAPRPAGLTIGHDANAFYRAIGFEERSNRLLTNAEIEVANKDIFQVFSLAI